MRNSFTEPTEWVSEWSEYKHLIPIIFFPIYSSYSFHWNVFFIQSPFQFHNNFFLSFFLPNKMKCFLFDWMDMDGTWKRVTLQLSVQCAELLYNKIDDWILILLWISSHFFSSSSSSSFSFVHSTNRDWGNNPSPKWFYHNR